MRPGSFLLLATLGAALVSCDHTPTDPTTAVSAAAEPAGIRLVNGMPEPIYFTVPANTDLLAVALLADCKTSTNGCNALGPLSDTVIPWSSMLGQGRAGDYAFAWWHGSPFAVDERGSHPMRVFWSGFTLLRAPAAEPRFGP